METSSKERDGGGEGKSLAYELGSVRGEKFCVIINRIGGGGGGLGGGLGNFICGIYRCDIWVSGILFFPLLSKK